MSAMRSFAGWGALSKGRNGFEFWVLGFEFCVGACGLRHSWLTSVIYAEAYKQDGSVRLIILKTQNPKPKTQNLSSPLVRFIYARAALRISPATSPSAFACFGLNHGK